MNSPIRRISSHTGDVLSNVVASDGSFTSRVSAEAPCIARTHYIEHLVGDDRTTVAASRRDGTLGKSRSRGERSLSRRGAGHCAKGRSAWRADYADGAGRIRASDTGHVVWGPCIAAL